jgi:hypothetical protein
MGSIPIYITQLSQIKFVPGGRTDTPTDMKTLIVAFRNNVKAPKTVFIFPSHCCSIEFSLSQKTIVSFHIVTNY